MFRGVALPRRLIHRPAGYVDTVPEPTEIKIELRMADRFAAKVRLEILFGDVALVHGAVDQHVVVHFPVHGGPNSLRIRLQDDFALHVSANLPPLGGSSRNLKVVSRTWNTSRDRLEVEVAGLAGNEYEIPLRGAEQIAGVEGAELVASGQGKGHLRVRFPAADGAYVPRKILIRFNTGR